MKPYKLSESAKADLIDIWTYTYGKWGEGQADTYHRQLHQCCDAIVSGSAIIRPFEKRKGYFSHHCQHHYIFFTELEDAFFILAILHERMDKVRRVIARLRSM